MYSISGRVRYSEINKQNKLDLFSIVNYFQDCSTFQSEDEGVGLAYLTEHSRVWLMHSWQIVLCRCPALAEYITIATWPHGFQGMYGYRNFLMTDQEGRACAYANSIWVFADTQTGHPVRCPDDVIQNYKLEPPYEMEYAPRKIAVPETRIPADPFYVLPTDIDTNDHVNNGQYIRMAEEFLPDTFDIGQMRAEYRSPAVLGSRILPELSQEPSGAKCTVVLNSEAGRPYAIVEFTRRDETVPAADTRATGYADGSSNDSIR